MKSWEMLACGFLVMVGWVAFWAVLILGGIWGIVKLLRHLEVMG